MQNPTQIDWIKVKRIFRHLKATKNYAIKFGGDMKLILYCVVVWANWKETRRSISGNVFMFGHIYIF